MSNFPKHNRIKLDLVDAITYNNSTLKVLTCDLKELIAELDKMREALEFYEEKYTYEVKAKKYSLGAQWKSDLYDPIPILADLGKRAREVLTPEE